VVSARTGVFVIVSVSSCRRRGGVVVSSSCRRRVVVSSSVDEKRAESSFIHSFVHQRDDGDGDGDGDVARGRMASSSSFNVALERVERPSACGKPYAVERGVVAPRGAAAGRALMTCEPYAAVVRRELVGSVCAETFRRLREGEGVEASTAASETSSETSTAASRFVGTRARDAANARGFAEAETLARASRRGLPSNEIRMVLQCLARRDAEARGDVSRERYALLDEDGFRGVLALHEGPSSTTPPDHGASPRALEKYVQIRSTARVAVALACGAMRAGITPEEIEERMENARRRGVDDESVLKLLSRFEVNGFTIADDDHQRLGFGIYPDAALFNQSLVPNAQVMFAGKTLVVKALRDIAPGEEVTIAYSEQYAPREWTRRQMRDSYGFDPYDSFGSNAARADEAREREIRRARRVATPSGDAEHVDLGEDACWYGGDLLPDPDLAQDSFWHALLDPSNREEWDLTAGAMLVKGEPDDDTSLDRVVTWGPFPPGVDRELTALNLIRATRAVDALTRDAESGEMQRAIETGGVAAAIAAREKFAAAETLLNGGRDVAGVGPRHELRKQLRLATTVVFPNVDDFEALEKLYESCVGWSKFDTVYVHLRFMLFKIGFHAIDARVRERDHRGLKRLMKKQILTYNFLNAVMSSASCSGMVMYEEWARAREGYSRDLSALRDLF